MKQEKYLIPRNDICMSDAMPFSQHWELRIPVPISSIDNLGEALQNSYEQFKPGDRISVTSYADKNFSRLKETADFRVVSCFGRKIETIQVSDTVRIPDGKPEHDPISHQNLRIVSIRGAYEVQDGLGNIIDAFVDQKQAQDFIDNYEKITQPVEAPKLEDRSGWYIKTGFQGKSLVCNAAGEVVKEFRRKAEAEEFLNKAA